MKPPQFLICLLDILVGGLGPHGTAVLEHIFEKDMSKTEFRKGI